MGRDRQEHQGIFTAPMDHSYRANLGGDNGNNRGPRRPGFSASFPVVDPEPLPVPRQDAASRVFAFVEDLFFLSKIQDTGRKMNVKVEFVKNEKELAEKMKSNGVEHPSLIIFDLNNANAKPLTLIPKLKSKLKKGTSIIGFLSHVQGDLKQKAHEVGCDMVLPRSAFSQKQSGSIPITRGPLPTAAASGWRSTTWTAPSPISTRRSGSTETMPVRS